MSSTTTTTATQAITAENVTTIFPDVDPGLAQAFSRRQNGPSAREGGELEGYDEEQIRLMDEVCIVLDENDQPIGSASKKTCLYFQMRFFSCETLYPAVPLDGCSPLFSRMCFSYMYYPKSM